MRNCLRELRRGRGWTQGELADHLDVSRQTVNALETGRYDPSLPLAFRIARLFQRPLEVIFFPDEVLVEPAPQDRRTALDATPRRSGAR
jgi:putative transcriptional regulator